MNFFYSKNLFKVAEGEQGEFSFGEGAPASTALVEAPSKSSKPTPKREPYLPATTTITEEKSEAQSQLEAEIAKLSDVQDTEKLSGLFSSIMNSLAEMTPKVSPAQKEEIVGALVEEARTVNSKLESKISELTDSLEQVKNNIGPYGILPPRIDRETIKDLKYFTGIRWEPADLLTMENLYKEVLANYDCIKNLVSSTTAAKQVQGNFLETEKRYATLTRSAFDFLYKVVRTIFADSISGYGFASDAKKANESKEFVSLYNTVMNNDPRKREKSA